MIPRACDLVVTRWGARFRGRRIPCAIGSGGIRREKREGDGASKEDNPYAGVMRLEAVLCRPDRVRRRPGWAPIRPWMEWCDDPANSRYNRLIRRRCAGAVERLSRPDPLYNLIGVLDWNRDPPIPGQGSAIFLHVWRGPRRPTQGCVAFNRKDLLWILDRWGPRSRVVMRP